MMMFATVNVEAPGAGIPFLLTFGKTGKAVFVRNLREVATVARDTGVTVVIKQHGGNSATGKDRARIVGAVGSAAVRICYDAGNVLDYENQDPIADIATYVSEIRAFAIKDHRNTPKDEDCGPGCGEIDHYKLLPPVMRTGLDMPLACENIFEPLVPRAREYMEAVIAGLRTVIRTANSDPDCEQ